MRNNAAVSIHKVILQFIVKGEGHKFVYASHGFIILVSLSFGHSVMFANVNGAVQSERSLLYTSPHYFTVP